MIGFIGALIAIGAAFVLGTIVGWHRARAEEIKALRRLRVRLLGSRTSGQTAAILDGELARLGVLQGEEPR